MNPKLVFTAFFISFINLCQAQQETTHLGGDVTVRLKKKALSANYELTNINIHSAKMSFMLHEDFDVEQVYLNGNPIASSKNGRFCADCKVHTIWIDRDLTPQDTLKITVEGDLENFAGKGVVFNNQMFQAGTGSKWYPVLLSTAEREQGVSFASHTYAYIYDLNVKCGDCRTVLLASETSAENSFHGATPIDDIQLTLSTKPLQGQKSAETASSGNINALHSR